MVVLVIMGLEAVGFRPVKEGTVTVVEVMVAMGMAEEFSVGTRKGCFNLKVRRQKKIDSSKTLLNLSSVEIKAVIQLQIHSIFLST